MPRDVTLVGRGPAERRSPGRSQVFDQARTKTFMRGAGRRGTPYWKAPVAIPRVDTHERTAEPSGNRTWRILPVFSLVTQQVLLEPRNDLWWRGHRAASRRPGPPVSAVARGGRPGAFPRSPHQPTNQKTPSLLAHSRGRLSGCVPRDVPRRRDGRRFLPSWRGRR